MKPIRHNKGFTLVETLIAIFILSLIIATAMSSIQSSLQSSYYARDQITAYYLASEAVEHIHNTRTANIVSSQGWLEGMTQCLDTDCRVDAVNTSTSFNGIETCGGGTGRTCALNFYRASQNTAGFYAHRPVGSLVSGSASRFSRKVRLVKQKTQTTNIGGVIEVKDQVDVIVTVDWSSGPFTNRSFTVREELYNVY